jgi:hypothetical protein
MTKEEALAYCHKHADEFKRDCYAAGENGERQFACLIDCLESGHIKPEQLADYGMTYDEEPKQEEKFPQIHLSLEEHPFLCVRYALVQHLKEVQHELATLRLAKERPLESWERLLLPSTLQDATRDVLLENIDPWISLVDTVEDTIRNVEKSLQAYREEVGRWHEKLVQDRREQRETERHHLNPPKDK